MRIVISVICLAFILGGCNKQKDTYVIEPTIEGFAHFIAEDYIYGEANEFVELYLDKTYSTNLFLINLLVDSYEDISVVSCDDSGALLDCDGILVRMNISISDGVISKIHLEEGYIE